MSDRLELEINLKNFLNNYFKIDIKEEIFVLQKQVKTIPQTINFIEELNKHYRKNFSIKLILKNYFIDWQFYNIFFTVFLATPIIYGVVMPILYFNFTEKLYIQPIPPITLILLCENKKIQNFIQKNITEKFVKKKKDITFEMLYEAISENKHFA